MSRPKISRRKVEVDLVAAERERCACVVEEYSRHIQARNHFYQDDVFALEAAAKLIRSGSSKIQHDLPGLW